MITLDDLLRDLSYGELAQLNIGNFIPEEHESEPDPRSYAQLSSWINLGLKAIYSEFWLASAEIYIQQYEQIETYVLSYDYAVSNTAGSQAIKYIIDTTENPFQDNVLKIEAAFDEDGVELPMNDITEELSIHTPTYRSIQIPYPNNENMTAIQYRATHAKINFSSGMDPTAIEIAIPHPLHEALLWYVASRAFGSLGGDQGVEGNDYYQKYTNRVATVRQQGLYIQTEASNWRFDQNGWA